MASQGAKANYSGQKLEQEVASILADLDILISNHK